MEGICLFENSSSSQRIFDYINEKYGQLLSPVTLVKVCAIIAPSVSPHLPYLNIFNVAPTRQYKSQTSFEAQNMMSSTYWADLGDDITMNSILVRFKDKINRKCLFMNDCTALFATKSKNTKERLVSGLTVLLSEGRWFYGDRQSPNNVLEGRVSSVMNMSLESYNLYESKLLGSTLLERFLTIFHMMPLAEVQHNLEKSDERKKMRFKGKLKFSTKGVTNLEDYKRVFIEFAKDYSVLSMKSINGSFDQIRNLAIAHACLNERDKIIDEDVELLRMVKPYLENPFALNQSKIIEYHKQGRSITDICVLLGKMPETYKAYVYRVLKKAKERGVVE